MCNTAEPESGERQTVNRNESKKAGDGDSWQHTKIFPNRVKADFEPTILASATESHLQAVAEVSGFSARQCED